MQVFNCNNVVFSVLFLFHIQKHPRYLNNKDLECDCDKLNTKVHLLIMPILGIVQHQSQSCINECLPFSWNGTYWITVSTANHLRHFILHCGRHAPTETKARIMDFYLSAKLGRSPSYPKPQFRHGRWHILRLSIRFHEPALD